MFKVNVRANMGPPYYERSHERATTTQDRTLPCSTDWPLQLFLPLVFRLLSNHQCRVSENSRTFLGHWFHILFWFTLLVSKSLLCWGMRWGSSTVNNRLWSLPKPFQWIGETLSQRNRHFPPSIIRGWLTN